MKARESFLGIRKKRGPILNLEVGRHAARALVITEAKASQQFKRAPHPKREENRCCVAIFPQVVLEKPQKNQRPPQGVKRGAKAGILRLVIPRKIGSSLFKQS